MYDKNETRIASSELVEVLFGDINRYTQILHNEQNTLKNNYPDVLLDNMFNEIDSRIINICPMVLCDKFLEDLTIDSPDDLLAGIGVAMYSISTHDDIVDELPRTRNELAGLTYSGNIATLHGIEKLVRNNFHKESCELIKYTNLNHYYQTKIVNTLWKEPSNEEVYLQAISHTKYWVIIGLKVAISYANRLDLDDFVEEFAECYGFMCQIFDDMREIRDDVINKYWSLPVSYAQENNLFLDNPEDLEKSIKRSAEIAAEYLKKARILCQDYQFHNLGKLVERIGNSGLAISYSSVVPN